MSDTLPASSTPLHVTDRVSQKRPRVDNDDSDGDGGRSGRKGTAERYTPKRPRPTLETPPSFDPNDIRPRSLLQRLAYAHACRNAHTNPINSTHARLQQAKIEFSMLLDELNESEAARTNVDRYIERVKALILTQDIVETRPQGSTSRKDAFDEDDDEAIYSTSRSSESED